jgi:hypothetical protein
MVEQAQDELQPMVATSPSMHIIFLLPETPSYIFIELLFLNRITQLADYLDKNKMLS